MWVEGKTDVQEGVRGTVGNKKKKKGASTLNMMIAWLLLEDLFNFVSAVVLFLHPCWYKSSNCFVVANSVSVKFGISIL